ncbi:MAG: adenosylmethionine--8-amino-7-oxononanoate transaminase [Lentisphaerae bacterium GWF2_45_14]|nr:MAG: adenosylmethionine--8-amino-7-oxononanoate transaminase [Lentisphaerae bacterium GWF2_45_14]
MQKSEIFKKDRKYVWHPYTQEKHSSNIVITGGQGARLFTDNGRILIDAVSSWWVNLHGHANTYIADKIAEQSRKLEHVIFGGFTHAPAVELAERLLRHLPSGQSKIFYSDNGSTSVEIGLKMACQYWFNKEAKRTKIISFNGAYHGDTIGTMSVGARTVFSNPFKPYMFENIFIDAPVSGHENEAVDQLRKAISSEDVIAFIFEPLVQGTAGMVMHSADTLSQMIKICRENNVLTIADEVATGFGRTGKFFASDYLSETADIICLSKGITGGFMALGATSCTEEIYSAFYDDSKMKTFFHGHSYTANPLACSAALASLDIMEDEKTWRDIERISLRHTSFLQDIEKYAPAVSSRQLGTIAVVEIKTSEETSYFNPARDTLYNFFIENGVILRPLGNVIYILPPYCISDEELDLVYGIIEKAVIKFAPA